MIFLIDFDLFEEDLTEKARQCEKILLSKNGEKISNKDSAFGKVLLGYALKKTHSIERFSLFCGKNEKPYLKHHNVFFNISHSASYVICALSDYEVGCDVQKMEEYKPRIAQRFFSEKEQLLLEKSENRSEDFTKLWALKESILKKDGTGVSGLKSYCFAPHIAKESFEDFGCNFKVFNLGDAIVSVCSKQEETAIFRVTEDELTKYMESILKGD